MDTFLIVGALVMVAALLVLWLRQRRSQQEETPQRGKPRSKEGLDTLASWDPQATRILTASERKVYFALRTALPEHIVLAQVSLARFIKVPTRHSYSEWLRRVGVMCADIVICDSASQVVSVVDVRAPESQENERARQRHTRMDRVLKAAGIPLHVWREDALPSVTAARNAILGSIMAALPPEPPAGTARPSAVQALSANRPPARVEDDDGAEQGDPPSSTWFDELDASPPAPPRVPPRGSGSGPSIR